MGDSNMSRARRDEEKQLDLVHPVYLDVPMLVSFLAALEGGISFENEVTEQLLAGRESGGEASGKMGLPSICEPAWSQWGRIRALRSSLDLGGKAGDPCRPPAHGGVALQPPPPQAPRRRPRHNGHRFRRAFDSRPRSA